MSQLSKELYWPWDTHFSVRTMIQLVYDTNLEYDLTRESVWNSNRVEERLEYSTGNFEFRLKDDKNIRRIVITLSGKVMIYCKNPSAVEGSLPSIKSLTLPSDRHEILWGPCKQVDSPLLRKDAKILLRNTKTRWSITGYNMIVLENGTSAELEVPELYWPSSLSNDAQKMLQVQGNMLLAQKLLWAMGL